MGAKPPVVITMAPKLETVRGSNESRVQDQELILMFIHLGKFTAVKPKIIT